MELISIIIPVFNSEKYLKACLESVLRQTYRYIEILIVYTESSDRTYDICSSFSKLDSRIQILINNTGKKGAAVSRNIGLINAQGSYIGFVDSDDYICEDMYELLYKIICIEKADIAICKEARNKKGFDLGINDECCVMNKEQALQSLLEGKKYYASVWNKLFRKESLKGKLFKEIEVAEDLLFVWNIILDSNKVNFSKYRKYYYRYNPNGLSKHINLHRLDYLLDVFSHIENDIKQNNLPIIQWAKNRKIITLAQAYMGVRSNSDEEEKCKNRLLRLRSKEYYKYNCGDFSAIHKAVAFLFLYFPNILRSMYLIRNIIIKHKGIR